MFLLVSAMLAAAAIIVGRVFPIVVRASAKSNNLFLDTYFQTL